MVKLGHCDFTDQCSRRCLEAELQRQLGYLRELYVEPLNLFVDPILLGEITEMTKALAASPSQEAFASVIGGLLPAIVIALDEATRVPGESWVASSALELTTGVLEVADKGKLGDGFIAGLAPSLFNCLATAEDRDVIIVSSRTHI